MEFKYDFLKNYLKDTPLPLALERSLECQILSKKRFESPILDIGCGEGVFSHHLFADKIDVGIDPNKLELERAKHYGIYLELINCFGDNIPHKAKKFKTIFSNSVMEHIPNIDQVLQEAHRLLDDDGVMYLTLPTNCFEKYTVCYQLLSKLKLKKLAKSYAKVFNGFWKHYHCYSYAEWSKIFEKNGFLVKDSISYGSKRTCILNAILTPFSTPSFFIKKILNRWFLFPKIRRFFSPLLFGFFHRYAKLEYLNRGESGLIFFEVVKR